MFPETCKKVSPSLPRWQWATHEAADWHTRIF